MFTHYIEQFTRRRGGKEEAICGAFVDPQTFSTEPTCPACHAACAADDADLQALIDMQPDPALLVKPSTFDQFAGYAPRENGKVRR